jgi:hypothetical protein
MLNDPVVLSRVSPGQLELLEQLLEQVTMDWSVGSGAAAVAFSRSW